ncbi:MAG: S8 family serine peptidase, partial [Methylococcaceae bacterium]|nr:S8 family serine peptidase [Methylococcaceae bacterium]
PRLLSFLLLVMLSSTVHSDDLKVAANDLANVLNPALAERLLLIGFPDQSLNRVQSASSGTYRKRGSYQSSSWSQRLSDAIAQDYPIAKLTEWPMSVVGVHCVVYQVLGNASVESTIAQLSKDPRVRIVQNMHIFKTKAHQYNDPYFKLQANLQQMDIGLAHSKSTGKNSTIAMIDTGVDLDHPELAGQISASENFASQISASFANDKHGTAVAGIMVARSDNGTGIIGIAPDAKLIALKACWPDQADAMAAVCNSFTLALAVNKAIQSGAKILNMSLTGPKDAFLELLLNKAIEDGMIVVAADAGEQNAQENFPASLKNVISVQSLNPIRQIPPLISITAPGEKILTTLPHGTYDFISGSSIAAAEVSGIIALLLELKPDLDINEVQAILQTSELPNPETAFSGINANTAVLKLCASTNCPSTF